MCPGYRQYYLYSRISWKDRSRKYDPKHILDLTFLYLFDSLYLNKQFCSINKTIYTCRDGCGRTEERQKDNEEKREKESKGKKDGEAERGKKGCRFRKTKRRDSVKGIEQENKEKEGQTDTKKKRQTDEKTERERERERRTNTDRINHRH